MKTLHADRPTVFVMPSATGKHHLMNEIIGLLLLLMTWAAPDTAVHDVIIRNGRIIDGTGSPWYSGDVAIANGRIAAIGNLKKAEAKRVIDADGMIVAPGF